MCVIVLVKGNAMLFDIRCPIKQVKVLEGGMHFMVLIKRY